MPKCTALFLEGDMAVLRQAREYYDNRKTFEPHYFDSVSLSDLDMADFAYVVTAEDPAPLASKFESMGLEVHQRLLPEPITHPNAAMNELKKDGKADAYRQSYLNRK